LCRRASLFKIDAWFEIDASTGRRRSSGMMASPCVDGVPEMPLSSNGRSRLRSGI